MAKPVSDGALGASNVTRPVTDDPADACMTMPLTSVRVTDRFWAPKIETNRTVSIPHIIEQNELTGRIDNFLKAAHKLEGAYQGQRYNDTDVYKVIEAASYSLAAHPDPALDKQIVATQKKFPAGQPIRARSSSNVEDGAGFNGAGLHDSYTQRPDEGSANQKPGGRHENAEGTYEEEP